MNRKAAIVIAVIAALVAVRVMRVRRPRRTAFHAPEATVVTVTTSILESMVCDIAGDGVMIYRLVPPRSCPGHFDLKPTDLKRIAQSSLFFRHDYQAHLDRKLSGSGAKGAKVIVVRSETSQLIPEEYLRGCEQVLNALVQLLPSRADEMRRAYERTKKKVLEAGRKAREMLKDAAGKAVLASRHQTAFCQWLGLDVVGVFDQGEDMSLKALTELAAVGKEKHVAAIVGNIQRGEREPKVIAERLKVPVVMLSNFPDPQAGDSGYIDLLMHNCEKLSKALSHE